MTELERRARCLKLAKSYHYVQARMGRQLEPIFYDLLDFATDETRLVALEMARENSRLEIILAEAEQNVKLLTPPPGPAKKKATGARKKGSSR